MTVTENNTRLFDWVYHTVLGEGGDGEAIVSFTIQDYRVVARQFQDFLSTKLGNWKMEEHPDHVLFIDNQEWIVIAGKDFGPGQHTLTYVRTM